MSSLTDEDQPAAEREVRATHLGDVGERRQLKVAGIRLSGRRRRPSGEKAPLPRQLSVAGWFWLAVSAAIIVVWVSLFAWQETTSWWTDRDLTVLNWFVDRRNQTLTRLMNDLHALGSEWFNRPLRWAAVLVLLFFKRWRHLFAAFAAILIAEGIATFLLPEIGRARPLVIIIGEWQGYSHPSFPVVALTVTLMVIAFALFPKGRWRRYWLAFSALLISLLVVSRMYLGVDHPTDALFGALLAVAVPMLIFRWFVSDDQYPVTYRRGVTAHLDIGGARGEAIRHATQDQLGLETLEVEPFGQEASGGSTPIRLKVAGDPETWLFAKVYSQTHLRSDRWYKVLRTILYGSLEDEVRFTSVRRLVEYEDYMMRLMRDSGVETVETFGIVELTPEREYLLVTEFFGPAREIGDAEITDEVIDSCFRIIRALWEGGLAHRDIKPANLLVRDDEVRLIDVAFATVRPSPWRQAVDLANMIIILGLRVDPVVVYEHATRFFTDDDIAEAFAATRGVTIPSQSRSWIKEKSRKDGVEVLEEFKELAPYREPIAIQRWSARRVWLAVGALVGALVLGSLIIENITGQGII